MASGNGGSHADVESLPVQVEPASENQAVGQDRGCGGYTASVDGSTRNLEATKQVRAPFRSGPEWCAEHPD